MELQTALIHHLDWKVRLRTALAERRTVDVEMASDHAHCALGQWLEGEAAARLGHLASYRTSCEEHKRFHLAAGQVVRCIDEERAEEAQSMLGMAGTFSTASQALIEALKDLREDAKKVR